MAFGIEQRRARAIERLNAASEVVETACGPVEFARRGEAPYVVIFHGTPQGHNASIFGERFEAAGFGTITPSRPGYLRTPLATGPSFEQQADAAAALLDSLSIDQVAAYAISGGGPSGIEFAARHPDRVNALILEVAISQTFSIEVSALTMSLLTNPILSWIQGQVLERLPRLAVGQLVKIESTLGSAERARVTADILASPEKLAYLRRVLADMLRPSICSEPDSTMISNSSAPSNNCPSTRCAARHWSCTAHTIATCPSAMPRTRRARSPAPSSTASNRAGISSR